jgi:hypothetical protein
MHLALLLLTLTACPSGVDVSVTERNTFTIKTKELALADLLECLSGIAHFRIIYDEVRPPRAPVSAAIVDASLKDAIVQLLRGRDLGYALAIDPRGRQEGVLILSAPVSLPAVRATESPGEALPETAVATAETPTPPPVATISPRPTGDELILVLANMPPAKAWAVLSAPGSPGLGSSPPSTLLAEPHDLTPTTR